MQESQADCPRQNRPCLLRAEQVHYSGIVMRGKDLVTNKLLSTTVVHVLVLCRSH